MIKDYQFTDKEKELNKVLIYHNKMLKNIPSLKESKQSLNDTVSESEKLLKSLGYSEELKSMKAAKPIENKTTKKVMVVQTWDSILKEADKNVTGNLDFNRLFTQEELNVNEKYIGKLNSEFNNLHKLDAVDYSICAVAGLLAAAMDIILVGIPEKTSEGMKAGSMSDYIRKKI